MMDNVQVIYLLQTREFVNTKQQIYKIGRTEQVPKNRFAAYPKGSELHLLCSVNNNRSAEKKLINEFCINFKQCNFGTEYFEGELDKMKKIFYQIASEYPSSVKIEYDDIIGKRNMIYKTDVDNACQKDNKQKKAIMKYCSVCSYETDDTGNWSRHVNSKKHKEKCLKEGVTITYKTKIDKNEEKNKIKKLEEKIKEQEEKIKEQENEILKLKQQTLKEQCEQLKQINSKLLDHLLSQ